MTMLQRVQGDVSRIKARMKALLAGMLMLTGPGLLADGAFDEHHQPSSANDILAPVNGAQFGIGQVVTFTCRDTYRPCSWSFGDGATSGYTGMYHAASCTHAYSAAGTYTVTLHYPRFGKLGDGWEAETHKISITIIPPPVVTAFSAVPATINRGQSTTLNWATSAPGVSVNLEPGLGGGAISGSRTVAPTSTTTYTLTASNLSGAVSVDCTVIVNQPPVLGPVSLPPFEAGRIIHQVIPAAAADPENDPMTYGVANLPHGLAFEAASRTLSGVVAAEGSYPFTYIVADAKGASSSMPVTLTVIARSAPAHESTARIDYGYDDQGRLTTLTYPSGRVVTYAYDDLDRVVSVSQNGSAVIPQITYDAWGNPQRRQYGSRAMDEWAYDASGTRVNRWTLGTVSGMPESRSYGYDAADRLTQAGEWGTLTYDANSRLTKAVGFGLTNTLAHDAYHNNTSSVTTSVGAVPPTMNHFTFNPMLDNHLPAQTTSGGLTRVERNHLGEIVILASGVSASTGLGLGWDGLGRLTSAYDSTRGATEHQRYAASGLRVARVDDRDPSRNRLYAYTGSGNLLSEFTVNPGPAWKRDVVYLGSLAIAEIDAAGVHELHNDHLGSPRTITGAAGTVEGRQAYGPYGEQIQQSGYVPLTGYTGHLQTEPTGLIYMRGRFYSPAWHWFMNSDQGVDPDSLNQLAYVGGNPLADTDPTGMIISSMSPSEAKQAAQDRAQKARDDVGQWARDKGVDAQEARDFADVVAAENETYVPDYDSIDRKFQDWKGVVEKARGWGNLVVGGAFLTGDIVSAWQAVSSWLGFGTKVVTQTQSITATTVIDVNKLNHIFGKTTHNLGSIVERFGSQEAAYSALKSATEATVKSKGLTGAFEAVVDVAGTRVTVRGMVVDGAVKIGTAFKP